MSKSSLYYYLFIFLWYLQTSTEIRVLLYKTIQKHAIKEFLSQEPCKLNKDWEKGNIAPILQMGKWSSDNLSVQCRAVSYSDNEERVLKKQQSPETMQNKGEFKPYYTGKHAYKFKWVIDVHWFHLHAEHPKAPLAFSILLCLPDVPSKADYTIFWCCLLRLTRLSLPLLPLALKKNLPRALQCHRGVKSLWLQQLPGSAEIHQGSVRLSFPTSEG